MIRYVSFEDVNERHVVHLANSLLGAPTDQRPDTEDLLRGIQTGSMRLFDWDDGVVLVSQRDGRLLMLSFSCAEGQLFKTAEPLAADLKKLAADWQCDTIETTCFDPRLASVIEKLGGRVESLTLTLAVE